METTYLPHPSEHVLPPHAADGAVLYRAAAKLQYEDDDSIVAIDYAGPFTNKVVAKQAAEVLGYLNQTHFDWVVLDTYVEAGVVVDWERID